jgi:hypothetical protein
MGLLVSSTAKNKAPIAQAAALNRDMGEGNHHAQHQHAIPTITQQPAPEDHKKSAKAFLSEELRSRRPLRQTSTVAHKRPCANMSPEERRLLLKDRIRTGGVASGERIETTTHSPICCVQR